MVVNVGRESGRSKTLNMSFIDMTLNKPQNDKCNCYFDYDQSSHLFHQPSDGKKSQAKVHIITGSAKPQNIGLHVNTNLHVKPKKRPSYTIVKFILGCLLLGHLIWTTVELRGLREELYATKTQLDSMTESLESLVGSYEAGEGNTKRLESPKEEMPEGEHSLQKRAVEPSAVCSDCNGTRLARSVSRGPLSVHLNGAMPEISVRDGGIVAPWYIDETSSGIFMLEDGILEEREGIVKILEEGLYFIYAQMYYVTTDALNSYAINLQLAEDVGRGMRRDSVLAVCSAEAVSHKLSELSCYTALVRYLRRGDRIYITQNERNRKIVFRDNRSFLGFTLLNSPRGLPQ